MGDSQFVLASNSNHSSFFFFYSRIGYYVSSFQSIFTAEGVFHREAARVMRSVLWPVYHNCYTFDINFLEQ